MIFGLLAVNETSDMRMPDSLEDLNLGVEVLLQLLVETVDIYRLDSDGARCTFLCEESAMTLLLCNLNRVHSFRNDKKTAHQV